MPALLGFAALLGLACSPAYSQAAPRQLINAWEVHRELRVPAGTEAAVKSHLLSFLEYQDLVMFHPKFGYYASGRVNFVSDYQTFPNVLAPYFGHMIAEQIFRMWQGMRKTGTLAPREPFTIAEFGAGNGSLAESILEYLEQKAAEEPQSAWREFAAQTVYACYDRSPALSRAQRERNARFGKRFEAREGDATDPQATIPAGALKGVILSNELPDAFSVHKVILSADGSAEVGFVAPSLPRTEWERFRKQVPEPVAAIVTGGDRAIRDAFLTRQDAEGSTRAGSLYLTRQAFVSLLEALASSPEYEGAAQRLEFQEVYVPAAVFPELRDHIRRHARGYATELARYDGGVVTYINLGADKFIQGMAGILKAGYVITLDYGSNWEGHIAQDRHPHFRTYGPAHQEANRNVDTGDDPDAAVSPSDLDTSDPYAGPTLNDMTTDVNFSVLAAEGALAGLKSMFYGAQAALQNGTSIDLDVEPPQRQNSIELANEFHIWVSNFQTDGNYRLLVQQKVNTDPGYAYPAGKSDRLDSDPSALTDGQRRKASAIETRLATSEMAER